MRASTYEVPALAKVGTFAGLTRAHYGRYKDHKWHGRRRHCYR